MTVAEPILADLAERLASSVSRPLSAEIVDLVRFRIADTLAAGHLGKVLLRDAGDALTGLEPGLGRQVAATRFTETDDIHIRSCTTPGSVVVPVALAACEERGIDDETVLVRAVLAGYDVFGVVGAALGGPAILFEGWWPTCLCAAPAVAAIRCAVSGAGAAETHASLEAACGRSVEVARGEEWSLAALGQVCEAELASVGPRSGKGLREPFGAALPLCGAPISGCQVEETDTKPFPTSRQALAGAEAFVRALDGASAAEVAEVIVEVPEQMREMLDVSHPTSRVESLVSVRYQMALAALDPVGLYDARRHSIRGADELGGLEERIVVREGVWLTAAYPARWGARVSVRGREGEVRRAEIVHPRGSARRRFSWSALKGKWERIFTASLVDGAVLCDFIQRAEQGVALSSARSIATEGPVL